MRTQRLIHAAAGRFITGPLLHLTDAIAAVLLAADLLVVIGSVLLRSLFNAPVEWSTTSRAPDGRLELFGAASALARGENAGVAFFVDRVPSQARRIIDAVAALFVFSSSRPMWRFTRSSSA